MSRGVYESERVRFLTELCCTSPFRVTLLLLKGAEQTWLCPKRAPRSRHKPTTTRITLWFWECFFFFYAYSKGLFRIQPTP